VKGGGKVIVGVAAEKGRKREGNLPAVEFV